MKNNPLDANISKPPALEDSQQWFLRQCSLLHGSSFPPSASGFCLASHYQQTQAQTSGLGDQSHSETGWTAVHRTI